MWGLQKRTELCLKEVEKLPSVSSLTLCLPQRFPGIPQNRRLIMVDVLLLSSLINIHLSPKIRLNRLYFSRF